MSNQRTALRRVTMSGMLVVVLAASMGLSWAEQVLKCPWQGVDTQLKTNVQSATATAGQPFEAVLAQDVRYKNQVLPAGTDFTGEISKVGHSKHFGRPGYVVLHVQQAALPNGQTFSFDPAKYKPRDQKIHNPQAETFPKAFITQAGYTVVSAAITVPIYYATDANGLALLAAGEGIRMAAGAVFGLFRPKYKGEPVARKLTLGALDGSGIPRTVGFFGKYPEADYHTGDTIKLYMNPDGLKDLFDSASSQAAPHASLQTHGRIQQAAAAQ